MSSDVANSFIDDNVGVTVGYTVFALTIQWGACVVFSIDPSSDQADGPGQKQKIVKTIVETSVNVDPKNKKAAGIMLLSVVPFIMVTLSAIFDSHSWSHHIILLITLIISSSSTVVYFVYSYLDRGNQEKSLDHVRFEIMSEVHKLLETFSPKNLIKNKEISKESLKSLFEKTDTNNDGKIQISELKDLTLQFSNFGRMKCEIDEFAKDFLEKFDKDKDGELEEKEFEVGVTELLKQDIFKLDSKADQKVNHNVSI
ncbi:Calcium-binding EF-hand family protein [Raphanus sativus]|nr:Calcium-binding EF-hand family protein [Raphanus sativus]